MMKGERRSKEVLRTKFPLALIYTTFKRHGRFSQTVYFFRYLLHPVMTFSRALSASSLGVLS